MSTWCEFFKTCTGNVIEKLSQQYTGAAKRVRRLINGVCVSKIRLCLLISGSTRTSHISESEPSERSVFFSSVSMLACIERFSLGNDSSIVNH